MFKMKPAACAFLFVNLVPLVCVSEGKTANPAYGGLFDPLIDSSGYSVLSQIPLEDRKDLGKATTPPSAAPTLADGLNHDHNRDDKTSFEHLSRIVHTTEKAALHALENVEHAIEDAVRDEVSVMFHDLPTKHHVEDAQQASATSTSRKRGRPRQGKTTAFYHELKPAFLTDGDEACHKFVDQETILQGFTGAM